MRAGALRLQALITTLPCLFIGIPAKTTPTIVIAAAVEAAEAVASPIYTARNALGNCTGSIATNRLIGMLTLTDQLTRSTYDFALILLIVKSGHHTIKETSCVNLASV